MDDFKALWAELAAAKIEREDDYAQQAAEDTSTGESAWLDYVLTFKRERALWAVLTELCNSLAPVSLPAPKATVRQHVARMILRRF